MKILTMMALAVATGRSAQAEEVKVYLQGGSMVPATVLHQAQAVANEIFSRVGVKIDRRVGGPSRPQLQHEKVIVVEMVTETPKERTPGALAFALPYEGVHIQVFYDRVQATTDPELTPNVLAHVLAHEITHILQGTSRHSNIGVMKAHWTHQDYMEMKLKPLCFTEEDVQLIRFGLAERANASNLIAAATAR